MATRNTQEGNEGTAPRMADQQEGDQATQARRSGQDEEHSRSVENVPSDQTVPEQVYADYAQNYGEDDAALNGRIPDVLLDAPVVSIKDLDFELDNSGPKFRSSRRCSTWWSCQSASTPTWARSSSP